MSDTPTIDLLKSGGSWNPDWDLLASWDAAWTEAYLAAATTPWTAGILPAKTLEFLCIAGNASCTHLYQSGLRRHIRAALNRGASRAEILAVLRLTTLIGLQAHEFGAPILAEALGGTHEHAAASWPDLAAAERAAAVLDAKTIELLGIVINASATHLYGPAVRRHVRAALEAGASRAEILEVLKVASCIGIHSCAFATPILAEELAARELAGS